MAQILKEHKGSGVPVPVTAVSTITTPTSTTSTITATPAITTPPPPPPSKEETTENVTGEKEKEEEEEVVSQPTQPTSKSKSKTTAISFLHLPGEIRNEIYEYALLFSPPTIPPPDQRNPNQLTFRLSNPPSAALLRTCKQVYEEATPVLYTQNVFPIWIGISGSIREAVRRRMPNEVVEEEERDRKELVVRYWSLWEETGYRCSKEGVWNWTAEQKHALPFDIIGDGSSSISSGSSGSLWSIPTTSTNSRDYSKSSLLPPWPVARYRHLINRLQITIFDYRNEITHPMKAPGKSTKETRRQSRMILMTSVYRLQSIIGDARDSGGWWLSRPDEMKRAGDVHVEIVVYPDLENDESVFISGAGGGGGREYQVTVDQGNVLRELAGTVWPLTLGGWRYSIRLEHPIEAVVERFGEVRETLEKACERDGGFGAKQKEWFRGLRLGRGVFWAVKNRRLVLVNERELDGM
ncbi:hypothetical protein TWF730_007735 [Orbilia blumenaviensis]|uniref:F-box domain-containing protein n=1 Tax=Orbilia blumenaviensis TaxID=1796055 RepID=A0AAV9VB34_9PEZI